MCLRRVLRGLGRGRIRVCCGVVWVGWGGEGEGGTELCVGRREGGK